MKFENLNDQQIARRSKLKDLIEQQLSPYLIESVENVTPLKKIVEEYKLQNKEDLEKLEKKFICCGRVMLIRQSFFVISEEHVTLQSYINLKSAPENLINYFKKYLDIGDFVKVEGKLFLTQKNELTLRLSNLNIISKCLNPLPEKYSGIKDKELLVRDRVAALITNIDLFNAFKQRSLILLEIRKYLNSLDYIEVETSMLHKISGGAIAKPFVTHYNALNEDIYLRIAPELSLKTIITAGYKKIFEIGKSFRNEGIDNTHNPEFTSMEIYTAYYGMNDCMKLTENIFHHIAKCLNKKQLLWNGIKIDIHKKFEIISIHNSVKEKVGIDFYHDSILLKDAINVAKKYQCQLLEHEKTVGHIMHKLFEKLIEPDLKNPTFIVGYHKDVSPLAKADPENNNFTLRFELFIGGKEFANGFAELNDPFDQLNRFEQQNNERSTGNEEAHKIDYKYIQNIEYGLPPCGGIGIGIDRLIMLFNECSSIKEVIFFPHLKK